MSERKAKKKLKLKWTNFLLLTAAGVINAVGVTLFLTPWSVLDGGFSGTSFLIFNQTDIPMFIWLLVLNIPFFLLAWRKMGASVIIYSVYAIGVYSLTTFLFQNVFMLCGEDCMQSPFVTSPYDIILAAIFGGLISGIGSGLTIRFGGAMDGVEVLGVMFAKRIGVTVGQFVMGYNVVLYVVAGCLLGSFQEPLYSIVAYAVGLKAVDFIVDGLDKGKAATIITDHPAEVAKAVSETMKRGITMLKARGYYSRGEKGMLYCVVNRFEISTLKRVISEIDPDAFVSITEVSDMMATESVAFKPKQKIKIGKKRNLSQTAKQNHASAPDPRGGSDASLREDEESAIADRSETGETTSVGDGVRQTPASGDPAAKQSDVSAAEREADPADGRS